VIKGSSTALRVYGDSLRRPYVDADIVVPIASFPAAMRELQADGWTRVFPDHRPKFSERFEQAVALRKNGVELDLHRMLVHPPAGDLLPPDIGFASAPEIIEVGGVQLPVLPPADALVHASAHAAFDPHRATPLLTARDIAGWAALVPPEDLARRAGAWKVGAIPAAAIHDARRMLGVDVDPLAAPPMGDFEQRLLDLQDGYVPLARFRSLAGVPTKLAYARAVALPTSAYLESVGQTRLGRLASALVAVGRRISDRTRS
jgi:hypothetical protein